MIRRKAIVKYTLLFLVTTALSFTGIQSVTGTEEKDGATPPCHKMKKDCPLHDEMMQARDAFFEETKELRRTLMMKRSEMKALMHSTSPDPEQVSALAGELFDLKEQMRDKARKSGLPGPAMGAMGMGHGCDKMRSHGCDKMKHGCDKMRSGGGHHMMKGYHHGQE